MTPELLQRIAAAVTPAVMISACGLLALGLENQVSRLSSRLRELAREYRELQPPSERRELVARQVELFSRRHHLIVRALLLNYLALFAFVATSFLLLVAPPVAIPGEVPLVAFALGTALLSAMAVFVMMALAKSRHAIELETQELYR